MLFCIDENEYFVDRLSVVMIDYFLIVFEIFFFFLEQRTRSQSQQKSRNQEDVCVRISLPPLVEGPVYANLICHIPKLRWLTKHQSLLSICYYQSNMVGRR